MGLDQMRALKACIVCGGEFQAKTCAVASGLTAALLVAWPVSIINAMAAGPSSGWR
jgi:hypothetical protein